MRQVFGEVSVMAPGPGVRWLRPRPQTWTVVGGGVDPAGFRAVRRVTADGQFPPISEVMPQSDLARLLTTAGPTMLTDDAGRLAEDVAEDLLRA